MARTATKKTTKNSPKVRQLKQPAARKVLGRGNKFKRPVKLSSGWVIFKHSMRHLWKHRRTFGAILGVYLLLTLLLVRGFGITGDLTTGKQAVQEAIGGAVGQLAGVLAVFSVIANSGDPASPVGATFQSVISVIVALAVIWTLRQTHAKEPVTLRDAFYKSTYPLVPFLLVLLVVAVQLLPIVIANFITSQVIAGGVAIGAVEKTIFAVIAFVLFVWSIYMVCASIFALFIVTLSDMTPVKALRSAKELVRFRRWEVIRKVVFLPMMLFLLLVGIMFPMILFLTPLAEPVFIVLTVGLLTVVTSYMYSLYRELLQ